MPAQAEEAAHGYARHVLSGLEFTLRGLPNGAVAPGPFDEERITRGFTADDARRVIDTLEAMATYATVRDAYLAFKWRGYNVEEIDGGLRFIDTGRWTGALDRAQQRFSHQIDKEWTLAELATRGILSAQPLEATVSSLPIDAKIASVSVKQLFSARRALKIASSEAFLIGRVPLMMFRDIARFIERSTELRLEEARRCVELLTFGSSAT